jgi:hypothetical protein
MKRYAANPQKSESLPGPSKARSVQLTSELYRLTGKITPFDAKEFQTMSDKQGAEHIAMHLLVDGYAQPSAQHSQPRLLTSTYHQDGRIGKQIGLMMYTHNISLFFGDKRSKESTSP